jgi:hypothetical protein
MKEQKLESPAPDQRHRRGILISLLELERIQHWPLLFLLLLIREDITSLESSPRISVTHSTSSSLHSFLALCVFQLICLPLVCRL